MTTYQTISIFHEASEDKISDRTLAYLQERLRNRLYDFIIEEFERQQKENGLTQTILAKRINKDVSRVNKWLRTPGNWTIDTISDLLVGISNSELKPCGEKIVPRSKTHIGQSWLYTWPQPNPENKGLMALSCEISSDEIKPSTGKPIENVLLNFEFKMCC